MSYQYEVLSPWAEVDPIALRGISPRQASLEGKKIGLFATAKRASRPILTAVEKQLKQRFPGCQTNWWVAEGAYSVLQIESRNRAGFEEWLKGLDAVVAAVGD
jgi:hypothetical protein